MENGVISNSDAKKLIAKNASKSQSRANLVNSCINSLNLSDKVKKDTSSNGILNKNRSRLYSALDELVKSGILTEKDDELKAVSSDFVANVDRAVKIKNLITDTLSNGGLEKAEILNCIEKQLSPTDVKGVNIRSSIGDVLKGLTQNGSILLKNGVYSIPKNETTAEHNARLLPSLADKVFCVQTVSMLASWYKSKGYDTVSEYTDSAKDGGVDGKISFTDFLEYRENVIIQVKNIHKKSNIVKDCEIKEFCGVLSAEANATKGLFVTRGKFHKDTVNFAKKYKHKYFVLIDGEKWLKLAEECDYVIDN